MNMNYDIRFTLMKMSIYFDTLIQILINKNLFTEEEFNNLVNLNKEKYPDLNKLEILANIEKISNKTEITDEDIKYIEEEGIKVDTKENIDILINSLKMKNDFKKIFNFEEV